MDKTIELIEKLKKRKVDQQFIKDYFFNYQFGIPRNEKEAFNVLVDLWLRKWLFYVDQNTENTMQGIEYYYTKDSETCKSICNNILSRTEALLNQHELFELYENFSEAKKMINEIIQK